MNIHELIPQNQTVSDNWYGYPQNPQYPSPCPNCGRCPTCGRDGGVYPYYPQYPLYPQYPQITYTYTNKSEGLTNVGSTLS